jgi:hypothetical protein
VLKPNLPEHGYLQSKVLIFYVMLSVSELNGVVYTFLSDNFLCIIFRFWKLIWWHFQMLLMLYWPMACSLIMIAHVLLNSVKRLAFSYVLFRFLASNILITKCNVPLSKWFLEFFCLCHLQHYSELPDIKRVIVNTHAIEPQVWIVTAPMS